MFFVRAINTVTTAMKVMAVSKALMIVGAVYLIAALPHIKVQRVM